ncbi:MAG: hypothetical protein ACI35P_08390 [Bacillus sp. (in: firmicutes)]
MENMAGNREVSNELKDLAVEMFFGKGVWFEWLVIHQMIINKELLTWFDSY